MSKKLLLSAALLFTSATLVPYTATAQVQAGEGAFAGVVTDGTKAAIPNAIVVLTNPSIGLQKTVKTNGAGEYQFETLRVVSGYSIHITAPGFATADVKNLEASVGTVITANVTLTVGSESTVIEVQGGSLEQVQTDTSSVSTLVPNIVWEESPLESRTQNAFVELAPGAAPDSAGTGRGFAVSGSRTGTGNFLVEGMDNNDQGLGGGATGGAVVEISPDAIQEYRIITHNPSAEYGRAGGFATDTSLKSGTNKWHGSAYEYNRIQALAAEHFFSNRNDTKDNLILNQFGGSIGGPIFKDRTFFYATDEWYRSRSGSPVTGTVTTQAFLNFVNSGAFETFQETNPNGLCEEAAGVTCVGAFNRSAKLGTEFQSLLAAEPNAFPLGTLQPSNAAQGAYTGAFGVTYPVPEFAQVSKTQALPVNQERATLKIDQKLSSRDQLSAAYLLDFNSETVPFGAGDSTFGPDEAAYGGAQLFEINETHTFSPTLLNLFRAGYVRHVNNINAVNAAGVPQIVTADDPLSSGFGAYAGIPQLFTENEFVYEDQLTKIKGRETFKAGFRFIRTRNGSSFYDDTYGSIYPWDTESLVTDETFDDQADAVLDKIYPGGTGAIYGTHIGSIYEASAAVDNTTSLVPAPYRGFRANEFAAYLQDDIKVSSKLLINLGVRWEYFGPPHNMIAGIDSNVYFGGATTTTSVGNVFLPNTPFVAGIQGAMFKCVNVACGTPGTAGYAPSNGKSTIWNRDLNNFAPRVGFSYDPIGNGKLAIRGGFGIGFDRLYNNVYENIRFNAPHFSDNAFGAEVNGIVAGCVPGEQPALCNLPFTANALFSSYGGKPIPRHIDQNLATAYYEQANFGFEYQLFKGYIAEVNYIGTFGKKLVGLRDANNYDGRTACTTLTAACKAAGLTVANTSSRPTSLFSSDNFRSNGFSSNYNGVQLSLRKSYSTGLQFIFNYTFSKAMDEISDVFTTKTGQTGITDPLKPSYDYGPADFDVRNASTLQLNYEIPFHSSSRLMTLLAGGFGVSTISNLHGGTAFSVVDSNTAYDPNHDGRYVDRAVYTGGGSPKNAINHQYSPAGNGLGGPGYIKAGQFYVASAAHPYVCANGAVYCDAPASRNMFTGPGYFQTDLGVFKRFHIDEHKSLTFQANFFNVANHPNFANPTDDINSPNFGYSQSTGEPRVTQLSGRIDF